MFLDVAKAVAVAALPVVEPELPETLPVTFTVIVEGNPTVIVPLLSPTSTSLDVPENVIVPPREVAVELEPSETVIDEFGKKRTKRVGFNPDVKKEDIIIPSWSNFKIMGKGIFKGKEDLIPPDSMFNKKAIVKKISYILNKEGKYERTEDIRGNVLFNNDQHDTI